MNRFKLHMKSEKLQTQMDFNFYKFKVIDGINTVDSLEKTAISQK